MKFLWNFWDGFCLNDHLCSCIASHFHFHNVSCILDVYSICWNDVFYLFDINCVWFFSACLSLSLSLSFYLVSLRMAPKRKSTPSRNPFRSGASSFSLPVDSTPSHVWFHDEKAHMDFLENFSWCDIHLERQVVLLDFFNIDLPTVIYSRGWKSLYGIPITCPSVIIHEFYSNMHEFDYFVPYFFTCIWGTRIVVTPDLISEVLHIPRVAHLDYPDSDRLRIVSKDELSSLFCETPSSWGDR